MLANTLISYLQCCKENESHSTILGYSLKSCTKRCRRNINGLPAKCSELSVIVNSAHCAKYTTEWLNFSANILFFKIWFKIISFSKYTPTNITVHEKVNFVTSCFSTDAPNYHVVLAFLLAKPLTMYKYLCKIMFCWPVCCSETGERTTHVS